MRGWRTGFQVLSGARCELSITHQKFRGDVIRSSDVIVLFLQLDFINAKPQQRKPSSEKQRVYRFPVHGPNYFCIELWVKSCQDCGKGKFQVSWKQLARLEVILSSGYITAFRASPGLGDIISVPLSWIDCRMAECKFCRNFSTSSACHQKSVEFFQDEDFHLSSGPSERQ